MYIISNEFHLTPSAYIRPTSVRLLYKLWWIPLIPLLMIAYGLAADWRWAVVGLMGLFIIFPMILTLAIFRYNLSPRVIARARAVKAELNDDFLRLFDENDSVVEQIPAPDIKSFSKSSSGSCIADFGRRPDEFVLFPPGTFSPDDTASLSSRFADTADIE